MNCFSPFKAFLVIALVSNCWASYSFSEDQASTLSQDIAREFWITMRMTPKVSSETLDYLFANIESPRVTWKAGETADSFFTRNYGRFSGSVQNMFWAVNESVPPEPSEDRKVVLTPGPRWLGQTTIVVPMNSTLDKEVYRHTGLPFGEKTREEIKQMNPGVDFKKIKPDQPIKIPNASDQVSYRLKAKSFEEAKSILTNLKKTDSSAKAITSSTIEESMYLVPHWGLTAASDSGRQCSNASIMKASGPITIPNELLQDSTNARNQATIAVIDSGIGTRRDPYDRRFKFWQQTQSPVVKFGENFARSGESLADNPYRSAPSGNQFGSHGTHVSGIATGRFIAKELGLPELQAKALNDQINLRIQLMVLKVTDEERTNGESIVLPSALYPAIEYAKSQGANIVNLSLAGRGGSDLWNAMYAAQHNMLFVAAAGNGDSERNGFDIGTAKELLFPALFAKTLPNVITVGAHDGDGKLACFSNYGKHEVDLLAPGVSINSTLTGGREGQFSGTSQAAPAVSFAAALLYSLGLNNPYEIKQRIISSVDVMPELRKQVFSGGKLNLDKALRFDKDLVELKDGKLLEGFLDLPSINLEGEAFPVEYFEIRRIDINFRIDPDLPNPSEDVHRFTVYKAKRNGDYVTLRHVFSKWDIKELALRQGDQVKRIPTSQVQSIITATRRKFSS